MTRQPKSLHVGALMNIMVLRWLQKCGGQTDPPGWAAAATKSGAIRPFRSDERPLLDKRRSIDAQHFWHAAGVSIKIPVRMATLTATRSC